MQHPFVPVFFFFQAEDGIRDATVTGVQTCALPIFTWEHYLANQQRLAANTTRSGARPAREGLALCRSEERRVGKECRTGSTPYRLKKNSTYSTNTLILYVLLSQIEFVSERQEN